MRFRDRVVIVTGAASGIGAATARAFSHEGAKVVLVDRDRARLDEVASELPHEHTLSCTVDVAQQAEVEGMVENAVARFGGLDVLFNNAGVLASGSVTETDAATWRRVMAADVDAVFFASRAAMPHLERSRGCIVNTASVSGLGGDLGLAAYNAAKGAIVNLTRAMAIDHGRAGVRVNAVCPTFTRTGMTEDMIDDGTTVPLFRRHIPLDRIGEPEDVARVVLFLASADAGFVTGVNLPVDGGLSAGNGQPLYGS
ncbi:SDR family NAD(P)-dependent oxidoreductase [Coralloluteibacterium thermophilus]|uniref:SDR family NAD(P)-dependent oxidoreductase n=1 Tax=Coralloluteibacterium thermophilum TaxID=2707049 RepID=A0ABV9NPE7_9GAMM